MARAAVESNAETTGTGGVTGAGFQPGRSGNPGGRPKGLARKARELCGDDGETVLLYLASIMADTKAANSDRIAAAKLLLERGWGKAPTFAPIEDGDPLELAEAEAAEIAASFDRRLDEVARKREQREGTKKPGRRKAS